MQRGHLCKTLVECIISNKMANSTKKSWWPFTNMLSHAYHVTMKYFLCLYSISTKGYINVLILYIIKRPNCIFLELQIQNFIFQLICIVFGQLLMYVKEKDYDSLFFNPPYFLYCKIMCIFWSEKMNELNF